MADNHSSLLRQPPAHGLLAHFVIQHLQLRYKTNCFLLDLDCEDVTVFCQNMRWSHQHKIYLAEALESAGIPMKRNAEEFIELENGQRFQFLTMDPRKLRGISADAVVYLDCEPTGDHAQDFLYPLIYGADCKAYVVKFEKDDIVVEDLTSPNIKPARVSGVSE